MRELKKGSDFSGVGAFDFALDRIAETKGFKVKNVFACDWDKHARVSYLANHPEPEDYPEDVYEREIPKESLDIYMTSPPCQAFSIAGKRKGKEDQRGILFFNSHEFIQKNKPRFFIFENVKGLLSDDKKNKDDKFGRTFNEWINLLGGKSVNGLPILFPYEDSVPYHIYYKTINTKDHGIPQNRERIFIIGIRDDQDNNFLFPPKEHLTKRLRDVLENDVDEKYFLSDNAVNILCYNDSGFHSEPKTEEDVASTICASDYKIARGMNVLKVNSATKRGFETAKEGDSINFSVPTSKTRRGRVGKGVAQTLDTACSQATIINLPNTDKNTTFTRKENYVRILSELQKGINSNDVEKWLFRISKSVEEKEVLPQGLYDRGIQEEEAETTKGSNNKNKQSESKTIDSYVLMRDLWREEWKGCTPQGRESIQQLINKLNETLSVLSHENTPTKAKMQGRELHYKNERTWLLREALSEIQEVWQSINGEAQSIQQDYRIRRLTPREAFRLQDFPDTFKMPCSDSQMYKQAGNSITVRVLEKILNKLKL